jgi:hypothetical protein
MVYKIPVKGARPVHPEISSTIADVFICRSFETDEQKLRIKMASRSTAATVVIENKSSRQYEQRSAKPASLLEKATASSVYL